jgi:nitrate reductase NapE component
VAESLHPLRNTKGNDSMSFLILLLVIFAIFAVAGWGWRFARGRR